MDKLLSFEFFRRLGFERKGDGITFIEARNPLMQVINSKVQEIDVFHDQKLDEIEDAFNNYADDIAKYKLQAKEERKIKIEQKKEFEKQMLKDQLRQEIMMEIEQEKEVSKKNEEKMKFKEWVPQFDFNSFGELGNAIVNSFSFFIGQPDDLKQIHGDKVKSLAQETDILLLRLVEINKELSVLNNPPPEYVKEAPKKRAKVRAVKAV